MITLSGRLICATEEEAARVRTHLPEHLRLTRAEPGCLRFTVEPTDDPMVWQVEEAFTDAAAFGHHQARSRESRWAAATAGIRRVFRTRGL